MKAGRAMLRKYGDVHIVEMGHRGSEGGEGDAQKVWGCSYSRNRVSRK